MITHPQKHTYKHTHTWIFNGIEMYLNMRSLVITWHYSFSRLLNNISVAGKPFVSSYQGFDWEKERNRQYFHNHMWATFKPHKTIKHHVVYFTSVQNHWKAHNMTYKDYCQVFLSKSKIWFCFDGRSLFSSLVYDRKFFYIDLAESWIV